MVNGSFTKDKKYTCILGMHKIGTDLATRPAILKASNRYRMSGEAGDHQTL
jgi:hypothetical protein